MSGGDTVAFSWVAHLAALAVEHRCTLVSYDHDVGRFDGVTWQTPSAG